MFGELENETEQYSWNRNYIWDDLMRKVNCRDDNQGTEKNHKKESLESQTVCYKQIEKYNTCE